MKGIRILTALTATLGLGFAGTASAITIAGTEVGSVDQFECGAELGNSSQDDEIELIETCTGQTGLVFDFKDDSPTYTADGGFNFIDVSPDEPGYFLLKFGGNNMNTHFVFTNLDDLNFLVWSDSQILDNLDCDNPDAGNCKLLGLSHYTYTTSSSSGGSSGSGDVPVDSSSLTLLGLGLLGVGFLRRRRSS